MTTKDLFEELKIRIENACKIKNYKAINCEELGFLSEDVDDGRLIHKLYKYKIDQEQSIEIDFRCYDQSKTFSIQPDMNKFQMKWIINEKEIEIYNNHYED